MYGVWTTPNVVEQRKNINISNLRGSVEVSIPLNIYIAANLRHCAYDIAISSKLRQVCLNWLLREQFLALFM